MHGCTRPTRCDACIVDEEVDKLLLLSDSINAGLDALFVCHIHLQGDDGATARVLGLGVFELVCPTAGDVDLHSICCERFRGHQTQTRSATGDNSNPTLDVEEGGCAEIVLRSHYCVCIYTRNGEETERENTEPVGCQARWPRLLIFFWKPIFSIGISLGSMSYPAKDRVTREENNSRWLHSDTGMWRYLLWGMILLGGSYREEGGIIREGCPTTRWT